MAASSSERVYGNLREAIASGKDVEAKLRAVRALLEGHDYLEKRQHGLAVEAFQKAAEADPQLELALHEWWTTLVDLGQYDAAVPVVQRLMAASPSERVYGNLREAIASGKDVEAKLRAVQALLEGYDYRERRQHALALEAFRKAAEADPALELVLFEWATTLVDLGDYEAAGPVLQRAMEASSFERVYGNLQTAVASGQGAEEKLEAVRALLKGYGLREGGQHEGAVDEFRRALELDPDHDLARHECWTTLLALKRYEEALPILRMVVAASANDAMVFGHLADVIERRGDVEAALRAKDLFFQGSAIGDGGDYEGMLATFREAIETDGQYGLPYMALGYVLLIEGDTEGSLRALHQGFEVDAYMAKLWQPLVAAVLETRDYEAAWREAERLEALGLELPGPLMDRLAEESGQQRTEKDSV